MASSRHEQRLEQQLKEEARLEELFLNNSEEEESVLESEQAHIPEESFDTNEESTEDLLRSETIPKDTTVKPGEVEELTKQLAEANIRYNRFKGSADKSLFDLRKSVADLTSMFQNAKSEISQLREQARTDAPRKELFNEDVEEVFGTKATDAIRSAVEEQNETINELRRKLEKQENDNLISTANSAKAANEADFRRNLKSLVPDLDSMNGNKEFNSWLRDPGADGIIRLDRLRVDQNEFDYHRVASFFIEYKNAENIKIEASASRVVKDNVANHIGPTGAKSGISNVTKDESLTGYIYQSEINQYNRDIAKNRYRDRTKDADIMEARIFKAMQENKIYLDEAPNN